MKDRPKLLVIGSFVMDHIATTGVFPRRGETVLGKSCKKAPGGKGANQAVQAARLGADVTMVGKLGRDADGEELLSVCSQAGIHTEHILFDEQAATGCSFIILEEEPDGSTANRILVIPGANMTIRPEEVEFLKDTISQYDLVILQLEIPMEINELVCSYAAEAGVPVMLNPAPSAPLSETLISRLTYLSPNEHEAQNLTGIHIPNEPGAVSLDDARRAAESLKSQGAGNVLITLGSGGAAYLTDSGFLHAPCVTGIKAVDPTAAGDSFVAAFCYAVCRGLKEEDALVFANHTAALTVSRMGAMPSLPTLHEVTRLLKERNAAIPELE